MLYFYLREAWRNGKNMRKLFCFLLTICFLAASGCSQKEKPTIVKTYEATSTTLIEKPLKKSKAITTITYYKLSDETWKTDKHFYKKRIKVSGKLNNSTVKTTYIILSNMGEFTFEEAWKAAGLSSSSDDYFKAEDAIIVGYSSE